MKLKIKRTVSVVLFLCIFILGLIGLYRILSWKDTSGEYFSSFEQLKTLPENTVEVVAIGPSLAYGSFNPAFFWREAGIASFTMAISGMDQKSAYYTLSEFVKKQSPRYVFLESSLFTTQTYLDQGNIYRNTMGMKPSANNIRAIVDIVGTEDFLSYFLRFPVVHKRYQELQRGDFARSVADNNCMGFVNSYKTVKQDYLYEEEKTDEVIPIDESTKEWVDNLIALSENNNFEIIFYAAPQNISGETKKRINGCFEYISSKGIKYIDLIRNYDSISIDFQSDFSDSSHINRYGADKVCSFLLEYMKEECRLDDHRGESLYSRWDLCTAYDYQIMLDEIFSNVDDPNELVVRARQNDKLLVVTRVDGRIKVIANGIEYMSGYSDWVEPEEKYLLVTEDFAMLGTDCLAASEIQGDIYYVYDTVTGNVVYNKTFY